MTRAFSPFKLQGFNPPVRRVLALDIGSRRLKMLLAESAFGRLRLLKEELIDLKAEGLVSSEELKTHLRASLEHWATPPVALVLPEHVSISQVIDLPTAPESEVDKLIAHETIKLSGVTESRVVYDFFRTQNAVRDKQQFWVTLCQEADIRERILRLGLEREDLCEVTTTANALIAAYRSAAPLVSRAILVHLGAQSTVVVVLLGGQAAFASSFQMGGDFFARAIARQRNLSEPAAEALKRERNLLGGGEGCPALVEAVEGWVAELKRQLNEWFQDNPALAAEVRSFELVAGGGAFDQPGLREHLKAEASLDFQPWPEPMEPETVSPSKGFEIVFGAAIQALGRSEQSVSLLPEDYRSAWQRRLSRQRLELASFVLVGLCLLLLGLGTWRQLSLYSAKKSLWDKVQAAQTAVDANDALGADLLSEYESLRTVAAGEQNTLDTLRSLALIQQSCSKSNFWYVLLADPQSYFSRPAAEIGRAHV
jgi:Tfp pilus assembly PilM family ATPase